MSTEVEWVTVSIETFVQWTIGLEGPVRCEKHVLVTHTLVGKRTVTDGEQTQLQLQFLCHRCAKEMSGVMSKDVFIEMMVEANARMGQVG